MRMSAATRPHARRRLDAESLTAYVALISVWGASLVAASMWARIALAGG